MNILVHSTNSKNVFSAPVYNRSSPNWVSLYRILVFLYSSHPLFTHAKTVSRIIDDTYGDEVTGLKPYYYPPDSPTFKWHHNCKASDGCVILADETKAWNGTWSSSTYFHAKMDNMGISLQFNGTAIWVYFILANNISNALTYTQCDFILDDVPRKYFVHEPSPKQELDYDVEVFSQSGLENKVHTLNIMTGKLAQDVYMNFDYARYTTEVPDSGDNNSNITNSQNPNDKTPVGAIVGAVIGGIVLLCVVALVAFFVLRRKRSSHSGNIQHSYDPHIISAHLVSETTRPLDQVQALRKQLRDLVQTQERGKISRSGAHDLSQLNAAEEIRQIRRQLEIYNQNWQIAEQAPPSYYS